MKVPFHKAYLDEREANAARDAILQGQIVGGGPRQVRVEALLAKRFGIQHFLATTSCTHALELAMMTLNIGPGDEVIIPTYTFSSTANSVLRQGAKVVFCDVQTDDLNIDVSDAASRITKNTRAILPVHYAGLPCRMEELMSLANKHNFYVIEDAAQAVDTIYKDKALGSWGTIGCYSFHGTKTIGCGEGGAFVTQDSKLGRRAEMLREKGTDRSQFLRGEVDKYTWRDIGSSFIPSEVLMAILEVQTSKLDEIKKMRRARYERYYAGLVDLGKSGKLQLVKIPEFTDWNYHIFYILLPAAAERERVHEYLRERGIAAQQHYYPLDASPFGKTLNPGQPDLPKAKLATEKLLRLPYYTDMPLAQVDYVIDNLHKALQ